MKNEEDKSPVLARSPDRAPVLARSPDRASPLTVGLHGPQETCGRQRGHGLPTVPQRGEVLVCHGCVSRGEQTRLTQPWHTNALPCGLRLKNKRFGIVEE